MMGITVLIKKAPPYCALLFILILASCASQSDHWAYDQIRSGEEAYSSSRLCYFSTDKINGIDVEFLSTSLAMNTYLHVHSIAIPCRKNNPKKTPVEFCTDDETRTYEADRHEGGQRLLLPREATDFLIAALLNKQDVEIRLPGYSTLIEEKGFSSRFKKLKNTPYAVPFHLPF